MILLRMLPGVLKELLKHVPTVLFKVIDWGELASELPKLSRRMLQKEGHVEMFNHQIKHLCPFSVKLIDGDIKSRVHDLDRNNGERLLELYFAQLFSSDGLFVDLRAQHFHASEECLEWYPSALWTKFSDKFRSGLLDVYAGFYLENEAKYKQGLCEIGLLNESWSDADKNELSDLFKKQFGDAVNAHMEFKLDHLRDAILGMSNFMLKKEVNISKDFLYLGIYLVTMYSTLETVPAKFPVKEIYLRVSKAFSPQ
jgi:hypothetical protein